ncbi:uncharacterized protein METZ01_LOCUS362857, partial [marine metagenome]
MESQHFLFNGPTKAAYTIALAHGAGGAMDSPFMTTMAVGLAKRGHRVARFEFPYMRASRIEGKRRVPDSAAVLIKHWQEVITSLKTMGPLIIGGKSLGGRIATMIADEARV